MKTIYKYELKITDTQVIQFPGLERILSVQVQNGIPCLWAVVNTDEPMTTKEIEIIGTGNPIEEPSPLFNDWIFIGTIQLQGFVWHVFDNQAAF